MGSDEELHQRAHVLASLARLSEASGAQTGSKQRQRHEMVSEHLIAKEETER